MAPSELPALTGAGLRNSKAQNLCYLNASLQALFHCHELRSQLESHVKFVKYVRTTDADDFADKAAEVAAQRGISAREPNLLPSLLLTMADMCHSDSGAANADSVLGELFRQNPAKFAVGEPRCRTRRRLKDRSATCPDAPHSKMSPVRFASQTKPATPRKLFRQFWTS